MHVFTTLSELPSVHKDNIIIIIIIISGLHHYECVAPLVANSLRTGGFLARVTAQAKLGI